MHRAKFDHRSNHLKTSIERTILRDRGADGQPERPQVGVAGGVIAQDASGDFRSRDKYQITSDFKQLGASFGKASTEMKKCLSTFAT
jgi:hypothetical protein